MFDPELTLNINSKHCFKFKNISPVEFYNLSFLAESWQVLVSIIYIDFFSGRTDFCA